ncbi:MAG TPA: dihydrofolate reductase family protein, partial [Acidimicrobiia bacterium]|nr:dihydrofolate reductase family protein [Acidimicrobiia bacterium]
MKLVVTDFVTIDGVMEGPGMDEHRDGKNAWALRVQDDESVEFNQSQIFGADALLFGRTTYQIWAAFWPTRPPEEDLARRLNEMPKYVVSKTLKAADWNNTTLISGDVASAVAKLKEQPGGDLLVYGSADLV